MTSIPSGNGNAAVIKALYRMLYKLGRKFDKSQYAKFLLYRNDAVPLRGSVTDVKHSTLYHQILDKILSNRKMYLPSSSSDHNSLTRIVNEEFRRISVEGFSTDDRLDVGFALNRKFSSVWLFYKGSRAFDFAVKEEADVRRELFPTSKISLSDHHRLPFEECTVAAPGTILVSHPLLPHFERSIILITERKDSGTYGLIINRPTLMKMENVVRGLPPSLAGPFGQTFVSKGGPVKRMQIIHSVKECGGIAIPSAASPFFAGTDVKSCLSYINDNPEEVHKFTFFIGCCCWIPGQLESELARYSFAFFFPSLSNNSSFLFFSGYWILGKSSPDRILNLARGITLESSLSPDSKAEVNEKSKEPVKARKSKKVSSVAQPGPFDVYRYLISCMGEKYKPLLNIPDHVTSATEISPLDP
jgi:putative transcriptional regulator